MNREQVVAFITGVRLTQPIELPGLVNLDPFEFESVLSPQTPREESE